MKPIEKELEKLMQLSGTDKFDTELERLKNTYTSEDDRKIVKKFIINGLANAENEIKEIDIKMQLAEISQFINMSYIAKHYFNRSKQWLSQRINGNVVSGKPRYLSESEKQTLNNALRDLSKRINAVQVS